MFKKVEADKKARQIEIENGTLRNQLAKAESNVDYLSMMSGIDLPEEITKEFAEGGNENE